MNRTIAIQIRVLGLGNLMRTDDAVGMLALQKLTEDGRWPRDIEVIEGGTLGLDLLHVLYGVSHLLVLDAVDTGAAPGTLVRFSGQELIHLPTSKSVHLLGLSDMINALRLMEAPPMEVFLLGVQPESTGWGTTLTSTVEAAQKELVEAALQQITQWVDETSGVKFHPFPGLVVRERRHGSCASQSPEE
jgi:hydrogenase maturation protease